MTSQYTDVKTLHREYIIAAPKWQKVRHAIGGELTPYLRNVGKNESDPEYGRQRQTEYEDGAICYNFTKRTLSGMVGSVMRKDPEQIIPAQLDYLLTNADGSGVGLWQHMQDTLMEIDSIGRGGLLADAPDVEVATMAQQNAGQLNPVIAFYIAENIINWRLKRVGSVNKVDMVVLREFFEYTDDENEFMTHCGEQYRVLDIEYESGLYRQRIYQFGYKGELRGNIIEIYPKLANVEPGTIPFTFIGASNNDSTIDDAPLLPLSVLNIGHFRNSADVEESSFVCSQPTLMIYPSAQMSNEQFKEANPNGIRIGSRTGHNLGEGGASELLQATESNLALSLSDKKEQQAIQIGAQLITPTQQITAESARLQRGADTSVMATIARNVSKAYEDALKWVADMMGVPSDKIEFKLNMDFFLQQMTPQEAQQWMAMVQGGFAPTEAMWEAMRRGGWTNWTDAQMKEGIENNPLPMTGSQPVAGEIPVSAQQPQTDNQQQDNQQDQK